MNSRWTACARVLVVPLALGATLVGEPTALGQLAPGSAPNFGTVTLEPEFEPDPQQASVVAGGGIDAQSALGGRCKGFVSPEPDVVLEVTGDLPWLRVYVTSPTDTTLIVRRTDGVYSCADDTFGLAPAIDGHFAPGRYAIWVGSYRADTAARASVFFTRDPEQHP